MPRDWSLDGMRSGAERTWIAPAQGARDSFFMCGFRERRRREVRRLDGVVRSQRHIRQHIALLGIIMPAVPVAEKAVRGREMFVMPPVCFLVTAHVNR